MRDGGAATTGVGRVALGARGVAAALVVGAALGVGAGLGAGAAARARTVTARGSTTTRCATGGSVIRVAGNDWIAEGDMPAMTGRCGGSAGRSRGVSTTGAGRTGTDAPGGATGGAGLGRRAATVAISVFDTGGNVRRPHKTLTRR